MGNTEILARRDRVLGAKTTLFYREPVNIVRGDGIWLFDAEEGLSTAVTSDRVNSYSVAWDPKGEFLYFLSDRNLRTSERRTWT